MNSTHPATLAVELELLLDKERENILAGAIENFAKFTQAKALLTEKLLKEPAPEAAILARIRIKASRNQRLLGAAVCAIRSVNGRLTAIRGQNKALSTYTNTGQRQQLGSNGNVRFERRT
ncbi:hypothetical protein [Falsihalocynthiibacter arcticus]|uniref:Flagellar biosynthesis protein FlgN n=1 Tax=Falsihalocynthiibacter arcticus TaxID=1579316 RepID=A0A126UYA9_9RHOB|nr:hypothetical protein [Falsihalocynthiibacter arcticus]AML51030.1 hypothetical protein RC74_06855 [Falsihalocynthiibacter arcticus]